MSNTSVGNLNIGVTVQLAQMQAQFDDMQKRVKNLNRQLNSQFRAMSRGIQSALGAIGVSLAPAALIAFGKSVIDLGSNINDLSQTAGVNAQAFQALSLHFADSGVSMEELSRAFVMLRKNTQDAVAGNKQLQASFQALKIDPSKLQGQALERQIEILALSIENATDKNAAFNAALDILGAKNAPKLMQALRDLATEGFDKIAESTAKWQLSNEQLKSLDDAGDKLARIWTYVKLIGAKGVLTAAETPDQIPSGFFDEGMQGYSTVMPKSASQIAAEAAKAEAERSAAAKAAAAKLASVAPVEYKDQGKFGLVATSLAAHSDEIDATLAKLTTSYRSLEDQAKAAAAALPVDFVANATNGQLTQEQIDRNKELGQSYRDLIDPAAAYERQIALILSRGKEMGLSTDEQARAVHELSAAMQEVKDQQIDKELTQFFGSLDVQAKEMEAAAKRSEAVAMDMGWAFSSAFEDAIIQGGKLSQVLRGLAEDILRIAIRTAITAPLGKFLGGAFAGMLGFAEGGRPPTDRPSLVGEQGPELFVPDSAGTIIPNGAFKGGGIGGGAMVIHNNFTFTGGVTRQDVAAMLPEVVKASKNAVIDAFQRGGKFRKGLT